MPSLRTSIESLANDFAAGILAAIRGSSLEEILVEGGRETRGPGGRARSATAGVSTRSPRAAKGKRIRRSTQDIARVAESIVSLVAKHGKGIRGEQLRKELGIAKNQWMKPLEMALASKKLRKTGEKRATTYFPAK